MKSRPFIQRYFFLHFSYFGLILAVRLMDMQIYYIAGPLLILVIICGMIAINKEDSTTGQTVKKDPYAKPCILCKR